jgi:ACT domain-containing protein
MDAKKVAMAQALRADPTLSVAEICQQLGVSETTFYRYTAIVTDNMASNNPEWG